jgi:hypothetical protein
MKLGHSRAVARLPLSGTKGYRKSKRGMAGWRSLSSQGLRQS